MDKCLTAVSVVGDYDVHFLLARFDAQVAFGGVSGAVCSANGAIGKLRKRMQANYHPRIRQ